MCCAYPFHTIPTVPVPLFLTPFLCIPLEVTESDGPKELGQWLCHSGHRQEPTCAVLHPSLPPPIHLLSASAA